MPIIRKNNTANTNTNNTPSVDVDVNVNVDVKALYAAQNVPHSTARSNLRNSLGYTWVHILEAQNGAAQSYDDAKDTALSTYRDIYDRGNLSEVDVLHSAFRFLTAFTDTITLPNLQNVNTLAPIAGDMLNKLNNMTFELELDPFVIYPEINDKLWKIIFFMWYVNRGVVIRDVDMFKLFDTWKRPVATGLPGLAPNVDRFLRNIHWASMIGTPTRVTLPCVLANLSSTPFADLDDVNTHYALAAPNLETLDLTGSKGVYLMRQSTIPPNKDVLGIRTTLVLRVIVDAYDTRVPVIDSKAMVSLSPYQVVTQCMCAFDKPNRKGTIELNVTDVLQANKSADMSAPASFFHIDFVPTSEGAIFFRVLDINKAVMKNSILAVDFVVDDTIGSSRANDFMTTPPLTLADINSAEPAEPPAVGFVRNDMIMACNDPAMVLNVSLDNFTRA